MAAFVESQGKAGADIETPVVSAAPLSPEALRQQQEAEEQRRLRFEAAKDKSDTPSPTDDQDRAINILLNATQSAARGSATQAAPFLQAALQDNPGTVPAHPLH